MNPLAPVAVWGFWVLLVLGWMFGELHAKAIAIFILLWLTGVVVSRFVLSGAPFTSYVAVLDVALVLAVFKGDVRLTGR